VAEHRIAVSFAGPWPSTASPFTSPDRGRAPHRRFLRRTVAEHRIAVPVAWAGEPHGPEQVPVSAVFRFSTMTMQKEEQP